MDLSWIAAIAAGSTVPLIGLIGNWIVKRTPEAKSSFDIANVTLASLSSELERTTIRLDNERAKNAEYRTKTDAQIQELRSDVEKFWNNTIVLKRHIVNLEDYVASQNSEPFPRPPEVEALF